MTKLLTFLVVALMIAPAMGQQCLPGEPCSPFSASGWQASPFAQQQAVPPMTRQYQGPSRVAPRGSSMGFITQAAPPVPPVAPVGTVTLPVAPPVPDGSGRLGLIVRDDVKRNQQAIQDLARTKADGGVTLPVQLGVPPGVSVQGNAELTGQLNYFHERLTNMEAWNPLLTRLQQAEERLLDMDPDKLKTELGRIVQADSKAALDKANEAATALEKATDAMPGVAKAAATEAVKDAVEDPSFLQRLVARAGEGIIPGRQLPVVVEAVKSTWTWQTIAGLGGWGLAGLVGVVVITFFVVRRRVPGAREFMAQGADQVANVIPGSLDNMALRIGRRILARMESGIDYAEEAVGIPTPAPRVPRKRPTKKAK